MHLYGGSAPVSAYLRSVSNLLLGSDPPAEDLGLSGGCVEVAYDHPFPMQ